MLLFAAAPLPCLYCCLRHAAAFIFAFAAYADGQQGTPPTYICRHYAMPREVAAITLVATVNMSLYAIAALLTLFAPFSISPDVACQ